MVNTKRPLQKPVKIDGASISQLLENLKHPVDGVRHRTKIELGERDVNDVIPALTQWVDSMDATSVEDAHPLLEALWVHQVFNVRNQKLLDALLASPEPHAAIAANTVKHFWTVADPAKGSTGSAMGGEEMKIVKGGVTKRTDDTVEVRINTIVEKMKYDVPSFEVKGGKTLKITFVNPDFMPHNIVSNPVRPTRSPPPRSSSVPKASPSSLSPTARRSSRPASWSTTRKRKSSSSKCRPSRANTNTFAPSPVTPC